MFKRNIFFGIYCMRARRFPYAGSCFITLQVTTPVAERNFFVYITQPVQVFLIGCYRFQHGFAACHERLVYLEKFLYQYTAAPSVHDNVMMTPYKLVLVIPKVQHSDPHLRACMQIESLAAVI